MQTACFEAALDFDTIDVVAACSLGTLAFVAAVLFSNADNVIGCCYTWG